MEGMIKIAMICHFSNTEVRSHLPLDNRRLFSIVRKLLRMPTKGRGYGDVAPWDSNIIAGMKERDDIELHVISAHTGLKRKVVSYYEDNIHYNFVRCDEATLLKRLVPKPSIWMRLNPMRKRVGRIVDRINPDIILLFGAENAYISSTILGLEKYPRMVMCQTIYNNPKRKEFDKVDRINAYVEREIFSVNKYFSFISDMHRDLFKTMRSNTYNFKWSADSPYPEVKVVKEKVFDFVIYALAMAFQKGFPDVIEALAIVKEKYPKVKLNLVGGGSLEYKEELMGLVNKLGLKDNVEMTPFFEKQEDLFQHLQYSRFAVLPCKMDYVAGTMMQSMHYGLPLVVYETSGTPTLNSEGECVLIAKNSDIADLAQKMLWLMDNPDQARAMAIRAKVFADNKTDRRKAVNEIVENCRAIVKFEKEGLKIPESLQF